MNPYSVNLLEYLRSKTQVDLDSFDVTVVEEFGKCVDCTSNQVFPYVSLMGNIKIEQYEYYTELSKLARKDILEKTLELASNLHDQFPGVTFEELAVEVAAVLLGHEMLPAFTGCLHVMANPNHAYSKQKVVETAKRIHRIFALIDPFFPTARIVIKVAATWEGLQACRELRDYGIKSLATAVFTMEQVILAGEAGCVSISPFIHELRILLDPKHRDPHPLLDLCVQTQEYYRQRSLPTKVKACSNANLDELLQLAGVDALKLVPDDLKALKSSYRDTNEVNAISLFKADRYNQDTTQHVSYISDELKYRADFSRAQDGRARGKLTEAIDIFRDFQAKAEAVVKNARS